MTCGTRSADSTSNQCQNVTIHNVSTIKLTKSLNARASADDDRKDTDLSSQAEVDTVEETESSEAPQARDGAGSTGTRQDLKRDSDSDEEDTETQEEDTDGATGTGSGSGESAGVEPDAAFSAEADADVLVLAAAPGREGAEAPEILLEGLEPPSSTALKGLDIDALVALLPALGFSGAQDSVVRLPSSSVTAQGYQGPSTILVVGVGTGWADTDPLAVTTDDEAALGYDQTGLLRRAAGCATRALAGTDSAVLALPTLSEEQVAAVAHGAALGATPGARRRTRTAPGRRRSRRRPPRSRVSPSSLPGRHPEGQEALTGALVLAQATALTRDLVNEPPNRLTPEVFAERARGGPGGGRRPR